MPPIPLTVTADDYGLTRATSEAILRAGDEGVVTATSVLALAPGSDESLGWLSSSPLAVGVHLALVGEDPPLLSAAEVPTLVDRRGRLASSWRQLVPRLAAGRVDPGDVGRELEAQVERVAAQVVPVHLDTHQHVHLWPTVAAAVVHLAAEHGVARVRIPRPTHARGRGRAIAVLADRLARRVADAGLGATERFRGLDEAGGWSTSSLVAALEDLARAPGSVEINLHPGARSDPDRDRYRWGYAWPAELEAACSPTVSAAIERLGFGLVR